MAGQSSKKQVASNQKILKEIHLITIVSYSLFIISRAVLSRPAGVFNLKFILTSIPALASLFVIEKFGRPRLDSKGAIVKTGEDLAQEGGLIEYLFDTIYLTILLNLIAVVFGSQKIYWFFLTIPAFAAYKIYGIINAGKQMFGLGGGDKGKKAPGAEASAKVEPVKSKRQQKMEARGDKQKVRYR
ncbi:hypothetical protein WICPIJ_000841 [Wickerhamomyces pijperi]|uniref:DUF788-domain-containing protein n=1 Tax=Wickerhamomyces pijperi TaxID=599730 RepID=A0A9P8QFC3_WICPI|nr:hypothetical protein WICPIJ_000841 [Wickerhamomyces pijperi]